MKNCVTLERHLLSLQSIAKAVSYSCLVSLSRTAMSEDQQAPSSNLQTESGKRTPQSPLQVTPFAACTQALVGAPILLPSPAVRAPPCWLGMFKAEARTSRHLQTESERCSHDCQSRSVKLISARSWVGENTCDAASATSTAALAWLPARLRTR